MNLIIKPYELFDDIDFYIILRDADNAFIWDVCDEDGVHISVDDIDVWPPYPGYAVDNVIAEKEIIMIRRFMEIPDIKTNMIKMIDEKRQIISDNNDVCEDDKFW